MTIFERLTECECQTVIQILDTFFELFVIGFKTLVLRFKNIVSFTGEQWKLFIEIGIYFSDTRAEQSTSEATEFYPFQLRKFNNRVEKPLKKMCLISLNCKSNELNLFADKRTSMICNLLMNKSVRLKIIFGWKVHKSGVAPSLK